MRLKSLANFAVIAAAVLFGCTTLNAQIVEKVKDATVDATKKTVKTTKNVYEKVEDKTVEAVEATPNVAEKAADATIDGAKAVGRGAKKFGNKTVEVTDNVVGQAYEGGKWFVVSTWDGTKWVSKRTWYATKKGASATKDAIVGEEPRKP